MKNNLRPVRVGVCAPAPMAQKVVYALDELLTAAGVRHDVTLTESRSGWDLFYADHPPDDGALWMTASVAARRYFAQPARRIEQTCLRRTAAESVRLPDWGTDEEAGSTATLSMSATISPLPDLAAAAFFFLSRWEEWQAPERDGFGRFPLVASVFGRGLWALTDCPVETYARALRHALAAAPRTAWIGQTEDYQANELGIGNASGFAVGLSHDIDTVRRWDTRGFLRSARSTARSLATGRVAAAARGTMELVGGVGARLTGRDPFQNVESIVGLEQAVGVRATYFLLPRHTHPWDGTHPAQYRRRLPDMARTLASVTEVGVHASTGATCAAALQAEREQLEALTGEPIRGVRFHNLRGGYASLPDVAATGFEYDSTLGFAEEPGFAAGIARPFRPYDRQHDRPLDLIEIPLVVMDTTLISPRYLGLPAPAGRERALATLEAIRRWRGAAALLWHNDNLPPNAAEGYGALYKELISWTLESGGRVCTLAEIADEWKRTGQSVRGG